MYSIIYNTKVHINIVAIFHGSVYCFLFLQKSKTARKILMILCVLLTLTRFGFGNF